MFCYSKSSNHSNSYPISIATSTQFYYNLYISYIWLESRACLSHSFLKQYQQQQKQTNQIITMQNKLYRWVINYLLGCSPAWWHCQWCHHGNKSPDSTLLVHPVNTATLHHNICSEGRRRSMSFCLAKLTQHSAFCHVNRKGSVWKMKLGVKNCCVEKCSNGTQEWMWLVLLMIRCSNNDSMIRLLSLTG